jgi:hypothetical protein
MVMVITRSRFATRYVTARRLLGGGPWLDGAGERGLACLSTPWVRVERKERGLPEWLLLRVLFFFVFPFSFLFRGGAEEGGVEWETELVKT